jgi:phosphoglycolate phosphatase-like HAD superfamily hydrolase
MPRMLLVLDFDGVICDSVEECFVSSWIAWHEGYHGRPAVEAAADVKAAFRAMRPFVRSGEDFVLIQDLLASGEAVNDQSGFDRAWERPGTPPRERFKTIFYEARTRLLEKDRRAWLSMNKIYPHVSAAISRLPPDVPFYILSTKKPSFVHDTLAANGIRLAEGRVLYAQAEPKLSIVEKLRESTGCGEAIFVEDQIDALRGNINPRIRVYLASWGYVQESWLHGDTGIPVLSPKEFADLLEGLKDEK